MNEKERTVIIPRGMVTVPEDDPVRVRLDWRTGLVKFKLERQEEERHGTKKENKE